MASLSVPLLAILVLGMPLTAADHDEPHHDAAQQHEAADERPDLAEHLSGSTGAEFDTHFLLMLVNHHRTSVALAQIAQERAEHDETKRLAATIIAQQEHDIASLTELLDKRGKKPGAGHANFRAYADKLIATLHDAAPDAIDRAFLEEMGQQHRDAIAAFALADTHAADPAIMALAKTASQRQQEQLATMEKLHQAWFGAPLPAAKGEATHAAEPTAHPDHRHD